MTSRLTRFAIRVQGLEKSFEAPDVLRGVEFDTAGLANGYQGDKNP